jgi:hypothetical protein
VLDGKTVGKRGVIWSNNLDVVFPCLTAMWELGVAAAMHNFEGVVVGHPVFKNFYQDVDFVVACGTAADSVFTEAPHIPAPYSQMDMYSYYNKLPEEPIYQFKIDEYPDVDYALDSSIDGNTIATVSYVCGKNGQPGVYQLSHHDACRVIKENIKLFNFSDSDRVLHTKSLYHGTLFLQYTMPALATTSIHYWADWRFTVGSNEEYRKDFMHLLSTVIDTCYTEHITKCLLPPGWIEELINCSAVRLPNTSILTIAGPDTSKMKELFDRFDFQAVYNNFGSSEVGSSIAVEKTTKSNLDNYDPMRFNIINPLVDLEIYDQYFKGKLKTKATWSILPDRIEINNDVFIFHGPSNLVTIKGVEINLQELNEKLAVCFNTKIFSLIVDPELDKLYVAFFYQGSGMSCEQINQYIAKYISPDISISKTAAFNVQGPFNEISPTRFITPAVLLHAFQNQSVTDYRD